MVLITVFAHGNEHTTNFNDPILQRSHVRLVSASFYNSWNVLKSKAEISITDKGKKTNASTPPGHYTPKSMANTLTKVFKKNNIDLAIKTNTTRRAVVIFNPNKYTIRLDQKLLSYLIST